MQIRSSKTFGPRAEVERVRRQRSGRILSSAAILFSCVVFGALFAPSQQNQQNGQQSSSATPPGDPTPGRAWTTSGKIAIAAPADDQQNHDAANTERRKQIADDSAKLLQLANDLKAEIDKTNKDTLSVSVIRKADEIEKLAHNVKEKMKLTTGPN